MKGFIVCMLVFLFVANIMVNQGEAITCPQVTQSLAPCVPYLISGGNPTPACCNGVKSITGMTPTTADRRAACQCAKNAASQYPNMREDAASSLPGKCGISLNFPISRTTNCNTIG